MKSGIVKTADGAVNEDQAEQWWRTEVAEAVEGDSNYQIFKLN
jgi:hypothetical protein